ncbi:CAMK/CAMKL/PASK protein kinase [Microbotryum lychnidis-dioicae p1A1 Lamole]|uniref:CAMK/CAMKL/PASK protein kinase n=1 Tax=Microbotryum lychnidis-dioicae (strain p1A1 Lamole / MvSl-1064) TaxID=683840 RepID=U5H6B0_USTV1|nr:CAMK/CAMKL/PASK protein kinase [Microbotryum lychnidis-dioicae p1A1 Lamole]|eukprot:KDE06926.1 CAMK/CAMKL/PASK protein kinase [Microbotryum lychnidis-dioicae p1A1 Lamole]
MQERHHNRSSSNLATSFGFTPSSPLYRRSTSTKSSPQQNRNASTSSSPTRQQLQAFALQEDESCSGSSDDSSLDPDSDLIISSKFKGKRKSQDLIPTTTTTTASNLSTMDGIAIPGVGFPHSRSSSVDAQQGPSLAQYIQQKRRQASGPFHTLAPRTTSLFGMNRGFTVAMSSSAPGGLVGKEAELAAGVDGEPFAGGRTRSRPASRRGTVSNLHLGSLPSSNAAFYPDSDSDSAMVMTPTTEEWRSLGGQLSLLADIRAKDEARLLALDRPSLLLSRGSLASTSTNSTTSSTSSSIDVTTFSLSAPVDRARSPLGIGPLTPPLSSASTQSFAFDSSQPVTPPAETVKSSFGYQTSRSGFSHSGAVSTSHGDRGGLMGLDTSIEDLRTRPVDEDEDDSMLLGRPRTEPLKQSSKFVPGHRAQQQSDSSISTTTRPNLSRGSLSTPMGTPSIWTPNRNETDLFDVPTNDSTRANQPELAPLDPSHSLGAIDPRSYSAVTGRRSIDSFVIESEAGRGAYGTVQKAREKGPDGEPIGPTVIIKYIIKQRILADCWKKHKILGPIPVEVHVLDHLRRVPYVARKPSRRKADGGFVKPVGKPVRRNSAPISLKEGVMTGHPNICGMLDFFEDGEFYYLVMPQAGPPPSNDLFDYVDLHPNGLPPSTIHSILSQLCSALDFLHSHNIVHRDIKDENIILSSTGHVHLIDFGSAAYVKDGKKLDTFSGTLDFAAPEVLRGARYGGKEQDLWALGVLGYVLICGECPFWSPEEAMKGLEKGSRADLALQAKIDLFDGRVEDTNGKRIVSPPMKDGEVEETLSIFLPRPLMSDAVDLVKRCLETDPLDRPTANWVCDHRFLLGKEGWSGKRGWELIIGEEEGSNS